MALSLNDFYTNTSEKYKISLLSGSASLGVPVSWMYLMEDIGNCSFIRGGELVITTGMGISDADALLDFVIQVRRVGACGVLFNLGNYLTEIPRRIIHWCNAHDFPLFSMPWDIHIADLTQYFCSLIMNDSSQQEKRSIMMRQLITGTEANFDTVPLTDGYVVACRDESAPISSYWGKCRINGVDYYAVSSEPRIPKSFTGHCGISDRFTSRAAFRTAAAQARRALKCAMISDKPYHHSRDNGLYDIALGITENEGCSDIASSYVDLIAALSPSATSTVFRSYLENNCSVNKVAQVLFLHRNTVNYHVQKAKNLLLNYDDSRLCSYLLAFYIRDCLQVMK